MQKILSRLRKINRVRVKLQRESYPRLQMLFLVTITGLAGMLASYILLHAGLTEMWMRYFIAIGISYMAFLFLLWLWLRTKADDYSGIADIYEILPETGQTGSIPGYSGKGGDFGGGGASGSFDSPTEPVYAESASLSVDDNPIGDALGSAMEAEEFSIPLVALILAGALIFSSFFIVYSAPVLFAELLVDGVLSASLYRRLRGLETRHWLETALQRTFWPFILTALFSAGCGWAMELYAPGAHSIGDVLSYTSEIR